MWYGVGKHPKVSSVVCQALASHLGKDCTIAYQTQHRPRLNSIRTSRCDTAYRFMTGEARRFLTDLDSDEDTLPTYKSVRQLLGVIRKDLPNAASSTARSTNNYTETPTCNSVEQTQSTASKSYQAVRTGNSHCRWIPTKRHRCCICLLPMPTAKIDFW
jgi:hypothetical protein